MEADFFDLTKLSFDGDALPVAAKVRTAIEDSLTRLRLEYANTPQNNDRFGKLGTMIELLEKCKGDLLSADGKSLNAARYRELAAPRIARLLSDLRTRLDILKSSGKGSYTPGAINLESNQSGLSRKNVEKVFQEAGFVAAPIITSSTLPVEPPNFTGTYSKWQSLKALASPRYPQLASLEDIYDFVAFVAAYLSYAKGDTADGYRRRHDPEELRIVLDELAANAKLAKATSSDALGNLCKELTSAFKSQILTSPERFEAFRFHFAYKGNAELAALFELLRKAPLTQRRDPGLAEPCLLKIREVLQKELGRAVDQETVLAVYNAEAQLSGDDPYDSPRYAVEVTCSVDGHISEFATIEEAQRINQCRNCGAPLFKECLNAACRRLVPLSLTKCPICGTVFPDKERAQRSLQSAEEALLRQDLVEAERLVQSALSADPGVHMAVDTLLLKLAAIRKEYQIPLEELQSFIDRREYHQASQALLRTKQRYPKLNLATQEEQIRAVLEKASRDYDGARTLDRVQRADLCFDILQACCDYPSAIRYLQETQPQPCASLSGRAESGSAGIRLSWERSPNRGVVYTLVRCEGDRPPVGVADSDPTLITICTGIAELTYLDNRIVSGVQYSYSVFASFNSPDGAISPSKGATISWLAGVSNLRLSQRAAAILLNWEAPPNCREVSIQRRTQNGEDKEFISTSGFLEDDQIRYGERYTYTVCARYGSSQQSEGQSISHEPSPVVPVFTIEVHPVGGDTYRVSWDLPSGVNLRLLVNDLVVAEVRSEQGGYEILLSADGWHLVSASAWSAGSWQPCRESLRINTYQPCPIDERQSSLSEVAGRCRLHIVLQEPLPYSAVAFTYFVRSARSSDAALPWGSEEEAITRASDARRVTIADYQRNRGLLDQRQTGDEEAYYVSVFT
ncbi:MAG: hypothetical protein FWE76_08280, partial [Symbiobacteriaceae bacterium]|nr:hypothetical protein [Symbiobacteriaceae bacterium]